MNPLEKPALVFAVAILGGLFLPLFSHSIEAYIIPLFVVAMTLSTRHITISRRDIISELPVSKKLRSQT